jgi:hypothetical protein
MWNILYTNVQFVNVFGLSFGLHVLKESIVWFKFYSIEPLCRLYLQCSSMGPQVKCIASSQIPHDILKFIELQKMQQMFLFISV